MSDFLTKNAKIYLFQFQRWDASPLNIQFTVKKKQQILILEELEPEKFFDFLTLKVAKQRFNYQIICLVFFSGSND